MPPPKWVASLPEMVLLVTGYMPLLAMLPPSEVA